MGKRKLGEILVASVMLMLCMTSIVGATYALWSDSVTSTNHLSAGELKCKLERTNLNKTYLYSTGYLTTTTNSNTVDFTRKTTENIFGIENNELLSPGSSYEATLKITNDGDVAFTYDVIINLTSTSNALAEQLLVYVDDESIGYLSSITSTKILSSSLNKNSSKEFKIKVVFENKEDSSINNEAQNLDTTFDLKVNATQKTSN